MTDYITITGKTLKALSAACAPEKEGRPSLSAVWAKGDRLFTTDSLLALRYHDERGAIETEDYVMLDANVLKLAGATDFVLIYADRCEVISKRGAVLATFPHPHTNGKDDPVHFPDVNGLFGREFTPAAVECNVQPAIMGKALKLAQAMGGWMTIGCDGKWFRGKVCVRDQPVSADYIIAIATRV